jgi:hypothetical protein
VSRWWYKYRRSEERAGHARVFDPSNLFRSGRGLRGLAVFAIIGLRPERFLLNIVMARLTGIMSAEAHMRFEAFSFGSIRIDGVTYDHDVLIDRGEVYRRKKKPSKKFRNNFGHTPLSAEERIPWKCRRLVIGTGTGALPVMDEVKQEARRRNVELRILATAQAIELLMAAGADTNAILHVTC